MSNHAHAFITEVNLKDFRSYPEAHFEFKEGVNTICGPNAQGKTNLLEAIYFLAIGRSFRTPNLKDLIAWSAPGFALSGNFSGEERVKVEFSAKERRIWFNQTLAPSLSSLIGKLPVVTLTPDDELIKGGPSARRAFLDIQLVQRDPLYLYHLGRYHKAMKQRNHLLKDGIAATIETWEAQMSESAAYITDKRIGLVASLNTFEDLYEKISGESLPLHIHYTLRAQTEVEFAHLFESQREREFIYGSTLQGPHRDELKILLNGNETRHFASEGQKRSAIAALRIASWTLMKEILEVPPIMLIDDFGVHLDQKRKNTLAEWLPNLGQVFITSVEPVEPSHYIKISAL